MYCHEYSLERYRPQQHISFEKYQVITNNNLDSQNRQQVTETEDRPTAVNRIRLVFTTILNVFTR